MSQSFTQFSESIDNLTPEEEKWLRARLDDKGDFALGLEEQSGNSWPGFDWRIEKSDKQLELWIYSEECGDINNVGIMVQDFFKEFRPKEIFTLTWSGSCSKMTCGDFGGGAICVTARTIKCDDTWAAAERMKKKLLAGRSKS